MIKEKIEKKTLVLAAGLALSMMLAIGMTGCGSSEEPAPTEETTAATEETTAAPATEATSSDQDMIGEDKALEIALADAGLTAADVSYTNVHLDTDDGVTKYEVDFHQGTTEYDYDIDPYTGKILERGVDYNDD